MNDKDRCEATVFAPPCWWRCERALEHNGKRHKFFIGEQTIFIKTISSNLRFSEALSRRILEASLHERLNA